MKLLFDQNLSFRLAPALLDFFPQSIHVREVKMETATDQIIWDYVAKNDFTIISKDSEFHQRSFLLGPPPKVIWISCGNASTDEILSLIRSSKNRIIDFQRDSESSFLIL